MTPAVQAPSKRKVGTKELAERLGLSVRTLQNYRDAGKIPFQRYTARTFRYDPEAVEQALSEAAEQALA